VSTYTPAEQVKDTGPLVYRYSSGEAITNDNWPARKSEILASLQENQLLEITGLYGPNEVNNTVFDNLGLARANAARQLFTDLPDEKFSLLARMVNDSLDMVNPFASCDINARINTENVKEIEDKTLIYFPFNSTNKLNSTEVENYLNDVASRVIASGEKVVLSGHTDNVGEDGGNIKLGQRRADIVKTYLISKGVPEANITATSEGKVRPVAENESEDGRSKNRRTELQIIK
jgi:outer membrane protein OmpA-like peptidoglycan-associated protein